VGEAHLCPVMMEFFDFIFYQGLADLPLVGRVLTWSNNWDSSAWSRIDKFCLSGLGSLVSLCILEEAP
jgi:hypothetical protein